MSKKIFLFACLAGGAPAALACDYPDEGNMPLRRALTRVQMLPETDAWHRERRDKGDTVQYRLFLDRDLFINGKCHWLVEAVAEGNVWQRFYVTPDGMSVVRDPRRAK